MISPTDRFVDRHIGPSASDQAAMLRTVGFDSLDALMQAAVPSGIRSAEALGLPAARTETEVLANLRSLSERNHPGISMIGLGYHPTVTPAVIRRNVLEARYAEWVARLPHQPAVHWED